MKILITGGTGLVGKHLQEILPDAIYISSSDCQLTDYYSVHALIAENKPDWVIHLAAMVGGILDNQKQPCNYFENNIFMNTNIVAACRIEGVPRLTGILSTCAYPDKVQKFDKQYDEIDPYHLFESDLHVGPPAESNFGYGIAKRAMATHIDMCNKQHGTKYNYLIPCNLYGEHDKFNPEKSHYVAALIRKIHEAEDKITLFGTGKPLRQFMYADDFAYIIKEMIKRDITDSFNVATPETKTIEEIARIAISVTRPELEIQFDSSMPDGQYRKDVSIEKFRKYFPDFNFTSLQSGIEKTYNWYSSER